MDEKSFFDQIQGKEVHIRLLTNDLLEDGKPSLTVKGTGGSEEALLKHSAVEKKEYTKYSPQSILGALADTVSGTGPEVKETPGIFVVVEEKSGSLSADDARYVEWLSKTRGERPRVVMVPEAGHHHEADAAQPHHLLNEKDEKNVHSFWKRQWRRVKALPAPITKDAAIAAIPRTAIPVGFSIFLAWLNRGTIPLERAAGYVGLAFGFAVGFALLNQTVLNYFTFWSEFPKEAGEPYIKALDRWVLKQRERFHAHPHMRSAYREWVLKMDMAVAKFLLNFLAFVSARGDVFIAGPLLGIGCTFLARLVLGAVGETASVLTLYGFFLVFFNVLIGSIAGGPYPQVIAHLRAVGKISNRTSMYLGILDTIKMEIGRIADFGMQTLYNVIQVGLAITFWLLLLVVDRCYLKPDVHRLHHKNDIEFFRRLFKDLRAREDIKKALEACEN